MDQAAAKAFIDDLWDAEVVAELTGYIRIPNKSPAFDPDWEAHGYMETAVRQFAAWANAKVADIEGGAVEVVRLPGRTPVILIEIPATDPSAADDPVLLYGHLDKQPEMTGWAEGLGPWTPSATCRPARCGTTDSRNTSAPQRLARIAPSRRAMAPSSEPS